MCNDKPDVLLPNDRRNNDLRSPVSDQKTEVKEQTKISSDVKASNQAEDVRQLLEVSR